VRFEFLLYDVSSTFFEGQALKNAKAARGYSPDSRPDCQQVCLGLVVTPEGLPVAYEGFAGNRTDVTTLREIVTLLEEKYGQAQRVWVGGPGEGQRGEPGVVLRQRGATYLVGTPKSQLKAQQAALLETTGWQEACPGLEVKLVPTPGGIEQFILCRSTDRGAKERAMLDRQLDRLKTELNQIHTRLGRAPAADREKAGRRIGRWLGQYPAAAGVVIVTLEKDETGQACGLAITERAEKLEWSRRAHGAHLLHPNHPGGDPGRRRGGGISS
jgi:hypothetical protein